MSDLIFYTDLERLPPADLTAQRKAAQSEQG